jgi:predicted RNA-binding Zn-ribbon protein involved in translation (DUF1610 family)
MSVAIDCQHCGVHIGETPTDLRTAYKFCPYCGKQIIPSFNRSNGEN